MKKVDLVRQVVAQMTARDGKNSESIVAREVQASAKSMFGQSISLPLIYMVLAQIRKETQVSTRGHPATASDAKAASTDEGAAEGDLLEAAAKFIRAAGTIGEARRILDQLESLAGLLRQK